MTDAKGGTPDSIDPLTLLVEAGDPRFATVGQAVVLDGTRSNIPPGCTSTWKPSPKNPGQATLVDAATLSPQVTLDKPGEHTFELAATCSSGETREDTARVYGFEKPIASFPQSIFVYNEGGVKGDNLTTGSLGRRYVFDPAQHPDVKGTVKEVWLDVIGKRLKMQPGAGGAFERWVLGASADQERRYWAFVGENRYAQVPVLEVRAKETGAGVWEVIAATPLSSAFGGDPATYSLIPHPDNPTAPAVKETKSGTFEVSAPSALAAPHRFYLTAQNASYRSLPTLVTLPLPVKVGPPPDLGVIYQIYVKQFADGDGDGVGDLAGLRQKLGYLTTDLGVDTVLLMPVFETPGAAGWGYNPADFSKVHPDYGSMQDLALLVNEAHALGLKLLLDFPINHVSTDFAACAQAKGNPKSPTSSWFHFFDGNTKWFGWDFKDDGTRSGFFAPGQSGAIALDLDNPRAREAMIKHVVEVLGRGVDGFRLDYVKGPSKDFWRQLAAAVLKKSPGAALVGEAWTGPEELGVYLREAGLNGVFDFPFHYALRGALEEGKADRLYWHFGSAKTHYGADGTPVSFTSNHDVSRVVESLEGKEYGVALAAASIVLTAPGNPLLFFGDEIGLLAHPAEKSADRKNGGVFLWGAGDKRQTQEPAGGALAKPPSLAEQKKDPYSIFAHHKALLALRKKLSPLHDIQAHGYHYGEFTDPGVYAMVRQSGNERVLVVVNLTESFKTVSFSERAKAEKVYHVGYGQGATLGPYGTHVYKLP
jgi:glycosidase